ncbi:MAG: MBOAT family protein [Bacteroidales bacterium]|nr:MBOAT family protein [Bacteroidales bacterium]
MIFNSLEFAIFLPIVFVIYWFVTNRSLKLQNLFIVFASYLFYGRWDWRFLVLIAFTSLCSWASGILIERNRSNPKAVNAISAANITLNLAILGVFKYYDFFISSFAKMCPAISTDGLLLNVILPVGISFYTFQALSYTIDVKREKLEPTHDIIAFFAYVSFFPQLVAGPIERATNLLPQFQKKRTFDTAAATDGMKQILWGLFKKVAVADTCAKIVNEVFTSHQEYPSATLALAAILFTIQIYGDFSGYSDIAIGTSKLFGIKLMRNFNVPFFSRDIAEFWRRWHISLTTWFRDYVYIPLGGSRCSRAKVIRNTFIIFLLSGFWHGANWTFIGWGAWNALLFLPLILTGKNRRFTDTVAEGKLLPNPREILQMGLTFVTVVLGFVIFRAPTLTQAGKYFSRMFSLVGDAESTKFIEFQGIIVLSIGLMLLVEWVDRKKEHGLDLSELRSGFLRMCIYAFLIFTILLCADSDPSQFIYFQF